MRGTLTVPVTQRLHAFGQLRVLANGRFMASCLGEDVVETTSDWQTEGDHAEAGTQM